jgi:hypothetical protein
MLLKILPFALYTSPLWVQVLQSRSCLSYLLFYQSQSYVTTDGQSASLSWNKAPIWGLRRDLYYCQTVTGLLMWVTLSDERTGHSLLFYLLNTSFITNFQGRRRKHLVKKVCLLIHCLAIDVILLSEFACMGMCLLSRCLAMGIHVTILFTSRTIMILCHGVRF